MAKGDLQLSSHETSWLYFFVDRFRLTALIALFILVVGAFAYLTLPRDLEPEVEIPVGVITAIYPGAPPADVENLVTREIEDKISGIEGIKEYESSSSVGFSLISVEFEEGEDLNEAMQELREKVDEAAPLLPDDVDKPTVRNIGFDSVSVLTLAIYGDYTPNELRYYAEDLEDALESAEGIQDIVINGAPEREIQIIVDPFTLLGHDLSVSTLANVLRSHHYNSPLGDLNLGGYKWSFRIQGRFTELSDILAIPVKTITGTTDLLTVQDIATVRSGYTEEETYSRYSQFGSEPLNTVSLTITKSAGADILKMNEDILARVDEIKEIFPADVHIDVAMDYSDLIEDDFKVLNSSGLQTIFLVFIVLMFFIGWQQAGLAAATVPFAILTGLIGMQILGFTLNSLSLFSLILTLGILVDNGIIMQEGVYHYRKEGVDPRLAAKLSIRDFKWPIIAGTATTISAFVPMLITPGIIGQFIRVLPITVAIVLTGSLFAALAINTTLSAILLKTTHEPHKSRFNLSGALYRNLGPLYRRTLSSFVHSRRLRTTAYLSALGLLILSFALPTFGILKIEMFDGGDYDLFSVKIEAPTGQVLHTTDQTMRAIEAELMKIPEIESFVSYTGALTGDIEGNSALSIGGSGSPNVGSISGTLTEREKRSRTSKEIVEELREKTIALQDDAIITFSALEGGPPTSAPIFIRVYGEDLNEIEKMTATIREELETIPYVVDIEDSIESGKGQYTFTLDRYKIARMGLSESDITSTLRAAVDGYTVLDMWYEGDKQDVVIKFDTERIDTNALLDFSFPTTSGELIPLREVASITLEPDYTTIKRFDGKRNFSISADVDESHTAIEATEELEKRLAKLTFLPGYSYEFTGENEDIEESFTAMFQAFFVAILLIASILILQFDSFKQPFIIMFTIPLSLIGVLPGLTILGLKLTFPAIIGLVALAGIVVNDAIVLIDRINSLIREHDENIENAVIDAGFSRLQPILLTTFTTIAGVLPLAYAQPIWAPLSWSIACGLLVTTFLTLFLVPMLYITLEKNAASRDY